jgi:hypothetical protein
MHISCLKYNIFQDMHITFFIKRRRITKSPEKQEIQRTQTDDDQQHLTSEKKEKPHTTTLPSNHNQRRLKPAARKKPKYTRSSPNA